MADNIGGAFARYDFVLSRRQDDDRYRLWRLDIHGDDLLRSVPLAPDATFDRTHQLVSIGGYLLEWGPLALQPYWPCYPYRLFAFDPTSADPLAAAAVQQGIWTKSKFWGYRADFGNPSGAHKSYQSGQDLMLLPFGNFVLNVIPTAGRGTFQLWNFDPSPLKSGVDPLPQPYTPQGSFDSIQADHDLIPLGNYVLDRLSGSGDYWLWSFDPQSDTALTQPAIQLGRWQDIDGSHQLVAVGDHVLDWVPADRSYRLWRFDPKCANPLTGPVRSGVLPDGFDAQTTLTVIQPLLPIDEARKDTPGTFDFMRIKIKHVVYLMLENRSFDHVCGWLYEKGETGIHFVGRDGPFQGASFDMFNVDPDPQGGRKVFLNKYENGKLGDGWNLECLSDDPYHDKSDVMRQYFYGDLDGYARRAKPDMGGFVWNNGVDAVMTTFTPEQLPVLNGLARHFAVSDEWFCSMPGPTDTNRAFALTGSALGHLNNFQNGVEYANWPEAPHRPSIWKVLWSNGFTDWKIYNSVKWENFVHTYHLFLQGQIPSVDADVKNHIATIDRFKQDAKAGKLPTFSFLEPIWISLAGTSSYHPGGDLVLGERALNEIYDALKTGPAWNETLFIITFDEHGGIFDHVPPPYAEKPWPNDADDGFHYDLMGVRVPTILVSPWIEEQTVFRSPTPVVYDSTSILATLLHWYGIPKARWGLGDRADHAPTFEGVFQRSAPRPDARSFTPPYDKTYPREGEGGKGLRVHDLHRLMTPRLIWTLTGGKLRPQEAVKMADHILTQATDLESLSSMIDDLAKRLS
jgi:phospholipase C